MDDLKDKIESCLSALLILIIWGLLFCYFASILWNYVMPHLFGLPTTTPLQMLALYFLIKMFFGISGKSTKN